MDKLYRKNELNFALVWIAAYVVLFSLADSLSAALGTAKCITAPVCIAFVFALWRFLKRNGLKEDYGLCPFRGNVKDYLYFLPLLPMVSTNLWNGAQMNLSPLETGLFIVSMLCVGFIEEVIFRGFLFKALCKDNVKTAILISSLTFGMGHIVNLLNGRDLLPTLLQVAYASAIGFLFTVLFYKGKSLWPCIAAHGIINSLSVFAVQTDAPLLGLLTTAFLCIIGVGYGLWILKQTEASKECPPCAE